MNKGRLLAMAHAIEREPHKFSMDGTGIHPYRDRRATVREVAAALAMGLLGLPETEAQWKIVDDESSFGPEKEWLGITDEQARRLFDVTWPRAWVQTACALEHVEEDPATKHYGQRVQAGPWPAAAVLRAMHRAGAIWTDPSEPAGEDR